MSASAPPVAEARPAERRAGVVVLSGGDARGDATAAPPVHAEARERLQRALSAASRVLQVGGSDDALQRAYLARHPQATWHRLGLADVGALAAALTHPQWPASAALPPGVGRYDLIVLPDDILRRSDDPAALLARLAPAAHAHTTLVLDVANLARPQWLQQWALGDLSAAEGSALASPHPHLASPASMFKLLMDAGWMPRLADACASGAAPTPATQSMWQFTDALGIPRATAMRTLGMERLVIEARRTFDAAEGTREAARPTDRAVAAALQPPALPRSGPAAATLPAAGRFTVVVPTTRDDQLRLNVELSPGLAEVGAPIVSVRHAADPGDALARADEWVDSEWVLLCHQDVYFPRGFGTALAQLLAAIEPEARERTLIGFAGMTADAATRQMRPAGFVIDRLHRFDHEAGEHAVSIDELALVVARRSLHRIDPQFGWHLWATDLCLSAITEHRSFARIVRLPLFHNSLNDFNLPASFHAAALKLAAKHAGFGAIHTLCGTLDEAFLARSRAAVAGPADGAAPRGTP